MPTIPNIEAANNGGFLWPSISDAVDTFLRRRHNKADPYERVWRLIHLWEATEITLSLAAMSRLNGDAGAVAALRRQREFFYGKAWDQVTRSFKSMQGAAHGAIDQWINILDEVAKLTDPPGRFLLSLKSFLAASIDMSPLVSSWAKACDVPPDYKRTGPVEVRTAMRYVNSFRNRLAHVPFPHDPLGEVADALEAATEQLFGILPLPTAHEKNGESSALTGAFRVGRCFLHGGQMESLSEAASEEIQFAFPCRRRGETEVWPGNSMLHVDAMMRPHILTRIKGHDEWEYTRFRAEANAVLVQVSSGLPKMLPEPARAEYVSAEEEIPLPPLQQGALAPPAPEHGIRSISDAIEAIRSEDYDGAISYFECLTQDRPTYHIGWLRLGYSRREKAVRLAPNYPEDAIQLLKVSLGDFKSAAQHVDPEYQAQAWYERSKSSYHLARLEPHNELHRMVCVEDAERAAALSGEKKFYTWWEYIQTLPLRTQAASAN
jgi:hypothetical protein